VFPWQVLFPVSDRGLAEPACSAPVSVPVRVSASVPSLARATVGGDVFTTLQEKKKKKNKKKNKKKKKKKEENPHISALLSILHAFEQRDAGSTWTAMDRCGYVSVNVYPPVPSNSFLRQLYSKKFPFESKKERAFRSTCENAEALGFIEMRIKNHKMVMRLLPEL
jgi:hypothetical protein